MLFGIIGTIDRGNFVFDRWPRHKEIPKVRGFITAGELSERLTEHFYYFGVFRKSKVFETTAASFSESCFIQIFNANEKRLEVVLGIDDECVIVSRSVFITNNENSFCQSSTGSSGSSLFVFEDLEEEKKNIVNSVTLAWRAENFSQVDALKNKLSFMVGILKNMEQSSDFLSRQIIKITDAKDSFEKKIKQKCLQLNKDISLQLEEFKVKEIFQEFYDLADEFIKDIEIFKEMNNFFQSCNSDLGYTLNSSNWPGSMGNNLKVPFSKAASNQKRVYKVTSQKSQWQTNQTSFFDLREQEVEELMAKTTLATSKKLQLIPEAFRDQRINLLYGSVLNVNDASLEEIVTKSKSLSLNEAIQTIDFIKANEIGVSVYPFDLKKYYNLYALNRMPGWTLIKKFDTKIFPKESLLKEIHPFCKFKRISALDEKLKYIILQNLIKEVNVYIYYLESLCPAQDYRSKVRHFRIDEDDEEDQQAQKIGNPYFKAGQGKGLKEIQEEINKFNLLVGFINKRVNLNELLREEPMFGKISDILRMVIEKMEKRRPQQAGDESEVQEEEIIFHRPKWGFYYVEEP